MNSDRGIVAIPWQYVEHANSQRLYLSACIVGEHPKPVSLSAEVPFR
jgi:hypothetical protein